MLQSVLSSLDDKISPLPWQLVILVVVPGIQFGMTSPYRTEVVLRRSLRLPPSHPRIADLDFTPGPSNTNGHCP